MKNLVSKPNTIASINNVHDWITDADKNDVACYYIGELSRARLISIDNKELNATSNYVWAQMQQGKVHLVQRKGEIVQKSRVSEKHDIYEYHYLMQRTGR